MKSSTFAIAIVAIVAAVAPQFVEGNVRVLVLSPSFWFWVYVYVDAHVDVHVHLDADVRHDADAVFCVFRSPIVCRIPPMRATTTGSLWETFEQSVVSIAEVAN